MRFTYVMLDYATEHAQELEIIFLHYESVNFIRTVWFINFTAIPELESCALCY